MNGTVSYTITSSTGEENFLDIPVKEALESIVDQAGIESKWVFIDGNHVDPESLTTEELDKGTVIILTDVLMGG